MPYPTHACYLCGPGTTHSSNPGGGGEYASEPMTIRTVDGQSIVISDLPRLTDFFTELPPDYHFRTMRKQQRELDEIYRNSQDLAKVPENYWQWRDEYFRVGKQYAFDRMMGLYDPEKHDGALRAMTSLESSAVRYSEPRSLVKWFTSLPSGVSVFALLMGMWAAILGIYLVLGLI
jgi:hypothetical protein